MNEPTDNAVLFTMGLYGGSFASALSKAWQLADPDNFARLRAAFPELWEKYRELAAIKQSQGTTP